MPALGETAYVVLVIKAGILEVSKVFADEDAANEFWGDLQAEYKLTRLAPIAARKTCCV